MIAEVEPFAYLLAIVISALYIVVILVIIYLSLVALFCSHPPGGGDVRFSHLNCKFFVLFCI